MEKQNEIAQHELTKEELLAATQERQQTIRELTSSLSRMQQELALLRTDMFGPKAEKVIEGQMSLDLNVEQFLPETINQQAEENANKHQ